MLPSVSPLFVVELPPNLACDSQIHSDVDMMSMTSSLLCRVSKIAENSLH